MFVYIHIKFRVPVSNGQLLIALKHKTNAYAILFYIV
jgi:hypothetical protein